MKQPFIYYHVEIPVNRKQTMIRLTELRQLLGNKGITFDCGTDSKIVDWELDYSLEGTTPTKIFAFLKRHGVKFKKQIVKPEEEDE